MTTKELKKKAEEMYKKMTLTVEKQEHGVWKETDDLAGVNPIANKARQIVDQFQYIYRSPAGEISLIHIATGLNKSKKSWEIYMLSNKNSDVERFPTKALAVARIKELLL